MTTWWTCGAMVAAAVLTCAGCGTPRPGQARQVAPSEVPYALLSPAPTDEPSAPAPLTTVSATTPVYLVAGGTRLQPVAEPVEAGPATELAEQALVLLSRGPTESERDRGLGSALGPDAQLSLASLEQGTATVEVELPAGDPAADQLPLVVGQVVLTLTSIEGIDRVQLVREGEPVEMALPGGARTTKPLGAQDYRALVGASPGTP